MHRHKLVLSLHKTTAEQMHYKWYSENKNLAISKITKTSNINQGTFRSAPYDMSLESLPSSVRENNDKCSKEPETETKLTQIKRKS